MRIKSKMESCFTKFLNSKIWVQAFSGAKQQLLYGLSGCTLIVTGLRRTTVMCTSALTLCGSNITNYIEMSSLYLQESSRPHSGTGPWIIKQVCAVHCGTETKKEGGKHSESATGMKFEDFNSHRQMERDAIHPLNVTHCTLVSFSCKNKLYQTLTRSPSSRMEGKITMFAMFGIRKSCDIRAVSQQTRLQCRNSENVSLWQGKINTLRIYINSACPLGT